MSLREEKKKKTKESILEAAIHLFSEQGYQKTSIEQIAKAAGVGKGTVYGYFRTKKDIIKGFCEFELEQIHLELVRRSDLNEPVVEQLKTIYMMEFRHITRNREFGRHFMRETVFPEQHASQDALDIDDQYLALFFPILRQAQKRGELREDIEPLHIIAHFYSIYLLLVSAWYSGRLRTEEVETSMDALFQQALHGLQPN